MVGACNNIASLFAHDKGLVCLLAICVRAVDNSVHLVLLLGCDRTNLQLSCSLPCKAPCFLLVHRARHYFYNVGFSTGVQGIVMVIGRTSNLISIHLLATNSN